MPHNRFFCEESLTVGQEVVLQGQEAHHLAVMRVKPDAHVELINGKGALAIARLLTSNKNQSRLHIESAQVEEKPIEHLVLAQALPRMPLLEWIIEKGTELNVDAFWLFPGHWSEKQSLTPTQTERLTHLIRAAVKQCGRLHCPTLVFKPPLEQWVPTPLLYGSLEAQTPYLWQLPPTSPVTLCIGPEAGFSPEELSCLKFTLHAQGIRLSRHTLRTETAAIAGLSLLQTIYK